MASILTEKKITVLDTGDIITQKEGDKRKYAFMQIQVWTGKTAGNMTVFAAKGSEGDYSDLEAMKAGEFTVDIVEDAGERGAITLSYRNPRPAKQPVLQQKPVEQKP